MRSVMGVGYRKEMGRHIIQATVKAKRKGSSSGASARKAKTRTKPKEKRRAAPKVFATPKRKASGMKPWTTAEVEEAFRRLAAAIPEPRGELEHINPYTLLVAVVLSAQATDAGVNKATPALFALADTPDKMIRLGEAKVRDLIKTIGLFRTKAKNVIALS